MTISNEYREEMQRSSNNIKQLAIKVFPQASNNRFALIECVGQLIKLAQAVTPSELAMIRNGIGIDDDVEAEIERPVAWAVETEGQRTGLYFDRAAAESEADEWPDGAVTPLYLLPLTDEAKS